jgi:hypothetical protein
VRPPAHSIKIGEEEIEGVKYMPAMDIWQIWDRRTGYEGWINIKVMAVGRAKRSKHAFWLGWNLAEKRFSQGNEYNKLKARHPPLLKWVTYVMRNYVPKEKYEERDDASTFDESRSRGNSRTSVGGNVLRLQGVAT